MNDLPHSSTWFHGASSMAELLRTHDWRASPLGPPERWPSELHTLVNLMLAAPYPAVLVWSRDSLLLYNDAYAPLLGARHPHALGRPFPEVWPELWPVLEPVVRATFAGIAGVLEDQPLAVVPENAPQQRWFTWTHSPVRNARGDVAGMYNTGFETTERVMNEHQRQFEDALVAALRNMSNPDQITAAASELLGQRLGASRVGYVEVQANGRWVTIRADWTNSGVGSLSGQLKRFDEFGLDARATLERGMVLKVDDVRLDPRTQPHARAYQELDIRALLAIPVLANGQLRAILNINQVRPRHWTDLDVALAYNMVEHTWAAVEATRSHNELRVEQEQSRYILDNIDEGFALVDHDWTVLQVNDIAAQLCLLTREQIVGRNHWDVFPYLLDSKLGEVYRRVQQSGASESVEYELTYPDGQVMWLDVRVYPSLLGRLAVFFRDISKRKLEAQELADASRRKDEFLAMLAHELRNPLAPIGAAADLLSIGHLDQERVRRTSAVIARQVKHMTSLVDDLLDVSRVTRGLVTLEKLPLDTRRIVADAVEQVRPLMEGRRHDFSVVLPPEQAYVCGDQKRLVQVLTNLMGNAAKYTPEGGRIVLEVVSDPQHVTLSVLDNGIGMTEDLTRRAFDLFAQAERTSDRSQGGLGLGLALVKSLVDLHHGSVKAYSPGLGKGSTFTVTLPRIDQPAPPGAPDRRVQRSTPEHGLRLLIVDDNADAASMLAMFLETAGHHVMIEHEPHRALERARLERPRVCLLDIGLPNMDGNELARRLRAQPETADAVLVAITGYGQEQDRRKAAEAGFAYHFVKPVDTSQLIRLLNGIAAG